MFEYHVYICLVIGLCSLVFLKLYEYFSRTLGKGVLHAVAPYCKFIWSLLIFSKISVSLFTVPSVTVYWWVKVEVPAYRTKLIFFLQSDVCVSKLDPSVLPKGLRIWWLLFFSVFCFFIQKHEVLLKTQEIMLTNTRRIVLSFSKHITRIESPNSESWEF